MGTGPRIPARCRLWHAPCLRGGMANVFQLLQRKAAVRRWATPLLVAGGTCVLAGCAPARPAAPDAPAAPIVELSHSWTSAGEAHALQVMADEVVRRGGQWRPTGIAGFENAEAAALNRIVGGQPPTAMQIVAGYGYADLDDRGLLRPVAQLMTLPAPPQALYPRQIVDAVVRHGRLAVLPIDVMLQDGLFYSLPVLKRAGVDSVPRDWPGMFAALDRIQAAGDIPLALGGQSWQEGMLFDAVLVSVIGQQAYDAVYLRRDTGVVLGPDFLRAVEIFGRLRRYVDRASPGRNWNDATQLVISGHAGFQLTGFWAMAEFAVAHQQVGVDFGCSVGFDDHTALIGGDVLTFPRDAGGRALPAQAILAQAVFAPSVQHDFARRLGALPARLDVPTDDLHPCLRKAAAAVRDPQAVVPAAYLTMPRDVEGDIEDVISDYWNTPDADAAAMARRFAKVLRNAT